MHEMDESEFQEQTGSSRARRHYYRLVAWNAVQLLIGLAAAGVAVGTTHWISEYRTSGFQGSPPSDPRVSSTHV